MMRDMPSDCACLPGAGRGFTLLELLIALTLVSLILALLFGGLRLGSRTWDAVERRTSATENQRVARDFIRRSLLQAQRVNWAFERRNYALFFGNSGQVEFVSPMSGHVGLGGLYVLRLTLVPWKQGKALVLQRWLLHPDVLDGGESVPEWQPLEPPGQLRIPYDEASGVYGTSLLLESVEELELRYFGMNNTSQAPEWLDEWENKAELPLNIGLSIDTGESWPEIIVPLAEG